MQNTSEPNLYMPSTVKYSVPLLERFFSRKFHCGRPLLIKEQQTVYIAKHLHIYINNCTHFRSTVHKGNSLFFKKF